MNSRITRYLPLLLLMLSVTASGYYWFAVASDKFESTALVSIQRSSGNSASGGQLASLFGVSNDNGNDALLAKEYMNSRDMLEKLSEYIDLKKLYSAESIDPVSRFRANASYEEFTDYISKHWTVHYDEASSVLKISVTAFDSATAKKTVSFLILESELFLNNINKKLASSQVRFATEQLEQSKLQVKDAITTLMEFQNKNGVVSPLQETKIVSSIVASMETELATKRTELNSLSSYLQQDAPEVRLLRSQIHSLTRQMGLEKQKMLGKKGNPLNKLNAKYQELETELSFRKDAYGTTLAALETARLEASRKLKHLVVIEAPTLADEAQHPRRWYNFLTYSLVALMVFWITKLGIATVRDHMD